MIIARIFQNRGNILHITNLIAIEIIYLIITIFI